jgi:uroporphyrinogen-III synthase
MPTETSAVVESVEPATPSLLGLTVGITADRRWDEQAELLKRRHASIVHGPVIRTLSMGPEAPLVEVTEEIIRRRPAMLIANTGIGMRSWFAAAESFGRGEALHATLSEAQLFARGPKAASVLTHAGLRVDARAASERLDDIVDMVIGSGVSGQLVVFQCHGDQSPKAVAALEGAGAEVLQVPVYQWILPTDPEPARRLIRFTIDRQLDALTFTSAPAIRNLMLIACGMSIESELLDALRTDVLSVAVGPVCASAFAEFDLPIPVYPDRFRLGAMIRTLSIEIHARARPATIAGVSIRQQGLSVRCGEDTVSLSDRESEVLRMLLQARPRVVSRSELLSVVWSDSTSPHVVDVTISRLRKRLEQLRNGAGRGIVNVPRRGYVIR